MPVWSQQQLSYCSNVHPGVRPEQIEEQLSRLTAEVRQRRGLSRMHAGLWINQDAAKAYQSHSALRRLRDCLDAEQLDVVTLNGFPQHDFHQSVVKDKVYHPSWAQHSRLSYSVDIAQLLAQCMPADVSVGTISTLPLAYRLSWDADQHLAACRHLCEFAVAMARLEDSTGKQIRLCLEMEPGCVLERTEQAIELFICDLPKVATQHAVDPSLLKRYLGVCYDVCHQAVMQESISKSMAKLQQADVTVGKIQVSSALQVGEPALASVRTQLSTFAEPKYLHQVSSRYENGEFAFYDDLLDALSDPHFPTQSPWWVHFHMPIQLSDVDGQRITTTREQIEQLCDYVATSLPYTPHMEVETYTWHVLPAAVHTDVATHNADQRLIQSIVNELTWLEQTLARRGLLATS